AEILRGARKYRLGLVLAHQELHQLQRDSEVASAVMTNPYARIIFQIGDADARALANTLSFFEARDLQNLEKFHAIARMEKSDFDFNIRVMPLGPEPAEANRMREAVITRSREQYAVLRAQIETHQSAISNDSEPPSSPQT